MQTKTKTAAAATTEVLTTEVLTIEQLNAQIVQANLLIAQYKDEAKLKVAAIDAQIATHLEAIATLKTERAQYNIFNVGTKAVGTNTSNKKAMNAGVGVYIKGLIADGLSNKEILPKVHAQYGNDNTTYACVAWYRNKVNKAAAAASFLSQL